MQRRAGTGDIERGNGSVLSWAFSQCIEELFIHLLSDGGQGIIELLKLQQISEAQLAWVFLLHSIVISLSSTWFALLIVLPLSDFTLLQQFNLDLVPFPFILPLPFQNPDYLNVES